MTEQEILQIATETALSVSKTAYNSKEKHCIGVHSLYKESVEMAESISYHAVKGKFPEKLFAHRSPNQTDKEAEYIKANYKQYTLPEFIDFQSTITRPFGDGNWSIEYREEENAFVKAGKSFQKYVESELPIYGSLETFVKSLIPTLKTIDANGFLAVRPKEIEYILNDNNEEVINSLEPPKPTIYFFESKNVIDYKEGEFYLFLSKEKSLVKHGGRFEKTGNVFEIYTKESVYFYKQVGVKNENEFELELFFNHDSGYCPVTQLKGIPTLDGDDILWQSPFIFGCDLLDCVTVNLNWLQFITNKCVFPMTVMLGSPCDFQDSEGNMCDVGYISDKEGNRNKCKNCNGVGTVGRLSPLGTLLINPASKFEEGETKSTQAPLSYIAPDTTTLDFIKKKAESDRNWARQILHLQTSNSQVKGAENLTATGMVLDNKAMTAFVKPIIDQIFDTYDFLLKSIGWQRYREQSADPHLSRPKTYDFKSPEDYLIDLTTAIEKGLPITFIKTLLFQYINSYYGDNAKTTMMFRLVVSADRLFGLSQNEINMKLARGTAAKWEDILNSSVLNFINDSISLDPKFIEKETKEQIIILQDIAKAKEAEMKGVEVDITKTLLP